MKSISPQAVDIEYPSSDGKPMAETELHRDWMIWILERLKRHFAQKPVYVSANLLLYYEQGNPRKSISPDIFAINNCSKHRRETFLTWEEGRVPDFVLETTSKTTRRVDKNKKPELYASLGIPEYFMYDPRGEWLKPPLQGFRLTPTGYVRIEMDDDGFLYSEQLSLLLRLEDGQLQIVDPETGQQLMTDEEYGLQKQADAEQAQADAEQAQADAEQAQADAEQARANAERARDDVDQARDDTERARADAERAQADAERARAEIAAKDQALQSLQEELARLKAILGQ